LGGAFAAALLTSRVVVERSAAAPTRSPAAPRDPRCFRGAGE